MPKKKSEKREKAKEPKLDEIDAQIIAILADQPGVKLREIAPMVGISIQSVSRRRKKYPKTDWFKTALAGLKSLTPLLIKSVRDGVAKGGKDAPWVSLKVLKGLGVLNEKYILEQQGDKRYLDVLRELMLKPKAEQERLIDLAESGGTEEEGRAAGEGAGDVPDV